MNKQIIIIFGALVLLSTISSGTTLTYYFYNMSGDLNLSTDYPTGGTESITKEGIGALVHGSWVTPVFTEDTFIYNLSVYSWWNSTGQTFSVHIYEIDSFGNETYINQTEVTDLPLEGSPQLRISNSTPDLNLFVEKGHKLKFKVESFSSWTSIRTFFFNSSTYNSSVIMNAFVGGYPITGCTDITSPGKYFLENDIINTTQSSCINISVSDVILDCQKHLIDADTGAIRVNGIYIYNSSATLNNITIKNCNLTDWGSAGIEIENANKTNFVNLTINVIDSAIRATKLNNSYFSNINIQGGTSYGIYLYNSSYNSLTDITVIDEFAGLFIGYGGYNNVSNSSFSSNTNGIYLGATNNNIFDNINSSSNGKGFLLYNNANSNTIKNSIINNNSYGVYLYSSSSNRIYNNLFNNTNNTYFSGTIYSNYWNTTRQTGIRIIYSNYFNEIGGNYWTNSTGNGYSDTCADSDLDGFCDDPYTLETNNVDYLPLTRPLKISVVLSSPPNNTVTTDTTPDFNFTVTGTESTYNCTLYLNNTVHGINSSTLNNTLTTITPSTISDGTYNWYINCSARGATNQSEKRTITIDTTPPTTTDDAPEGWQSTPFNITLTCSDSGSGCSVTSYRIDGGAWQTGTVIEITTDGNHTIEYNSTDAVGNAESTKTTYAALDTTPPTTTSSAVDSSGTSYTFGTWTSSSYINVTLSCSDSGAGCDTILYCTDATNTCTPNSIYSTPVQITTEGTSYIRFRANDTAGNLESIKSEIIKIDTTPPTTTDDAPEGWQSTPFNITLTCSDSGSGCSVTSYRIDGGAWQTGTVIEITTDGNHTIEYNSTDAVGNAESTKTTYAALDTTPPTTTSSAVDSSGTSYTFGTWTSSSYINVTLSCSDSGAGCDTILYCTDATNTCTPSNVYTTTLQITTQGVSYIRYKANDTVGNDEIIKNRTIKIDSIPPQINKILIKIDNLGGTTNISLIVNSTDNLGLTNRDTLKVGSYTLKINTTENPNQIDISDLLTQDLLIQVNDSVGNTQNLTINFSLTNNSYSEDTSYSHTLSTQQIQKNDTLTNTGNNEFYYNVTHTTPSGGTLVSGGNFYNSLSSGNSANLLSKWSGDWITSETEDFYTRFENSSYSHTLTQQGVINQTYLQAYSSYAFSSVDISSLCENTVSVSVSVGTHNLTTNCSYIHYVGDWLSETEGEWNEESATESQTKINKSLNVTETLGVSFTSVSWSVSQDTSSCWSTFQTSGTFDISAYSTINLWANQTGDCIDEGAWTSWGQVSADLSTQELAKNRTVTNLDTDYTWTNVAWSTTGRSESCFTSQTTSGTYTLTTTKTIQATASGDCLSESFGSWKQDTSYNNTVDKIKIIRALNVSNLADFNFTSVSVSTSSEGSSCLGSCDDCSHTLNINANSNYTNSSEFYDTGDCINETYISNYKQMGRAIEGIPITFYTNITWTNLLSSIGLVNITQTFNISSTVSAINYVKINGTDYYGTDLVSVDLTEDYIKVRWNYTISSGETLDPEFSVNDSAITVLESDPVQDYYNYFPSPYDAAFDEYVRWRKDISITNNANTTIYNITVNVSIPIDTVPDTTDLYDPDGLLVNHYENVTKGIIEFNISKLDALETQNWYLNYKTQLNVSRANWTETSGGKLYWKKEINISSFSGNLTVENIKIYSTIPNQSQAIAIKIYENSTEITNDPDYDVLKKDLDGDGNYDYVEFKAPEVTSQNTYRIVTDLGYTIGVTMEKVITNKPVQEDKDIEWRYGYKFENLNDFGVSYTYRQSMPIESKEIYIDGSFTELSFDTHGAYILIEKYVPPMSNITAYVTFKTPPIITFIDTILPETYWAVGENVTEHDTIVTKNVTIINNIPNMVEDIEKDVPILYGEDFNATCNGELINESDTIEDHFTINLDNISANSEVKCTLQYKIPTAEVNFVMEKENYEKNMVRLYEVISRSDRPLNPVKFEIPDIDCVEIVDIHLKQDITHKFDWECGSTIVNVGTLDVNEKRDIVVIYRKYDYIPPEISRIFEIIVVWITRICFAIFVISSLYIIFEYLENARGSSIS